MNPGYVYILTNPSMEGLIKIGKTVRDSRSRARELYGTGVPTPFTLAFEIYSLNHDELEEKIHKKLTDFRVSSNREFFRYPLNNAIKLLQNLNSQQPSPDDYIALEILPALTAKYPACIKNDVVSIRIVQIAGERVWLETTQEEEIAGYLIDQTIHRVDLGFIADEPDYPIFDSKNPVEINAKIFVEEMDPLSFLVVNSNIFTDEFNEKYQSTPHNVAEKGPVSQAAVKLRLAWPLLQLPARSKRAGDRSHRRWSGIASDHTYLKYLTAAGQMSKL